MTSQDRLVEIANGLDDAWSCASAVAAPTAEEPSLTTEDAYAIQDLIIDRRVSAGRMIAGWKMGLTTARPPATPIVGTLLDDMVAPSGVVLSLGSMVGPMVEAELVVRIGETIDSPQTTADLMEGPHEMGPGIEVIDYRTIGSTGVIDWIADNSTVAHAVVGGLVPISSIEPWNIEASLALDGRWLADGRSDLVMGNPLEAVSWLSGHLIERGRPLQRDDMILTGSLTGHHPVPEGYSEFHARFGSLGTVSVRFRP